MKKKLFVMITILLIVIGVYYLNTRNKNPNYSVEVKDKSVLIKFNNYEKVDDSPLYRAIKAGNITYIKSYVDSGKNLNIVDKYGVPALFYAKKDLNTLKFLINNGADINIRDKDGNSIICQVEHYLENKEILRYLFTNGIDINEPGCLFKTPPIFSAHDVETMKLLIELGANINYITEYNNTMLNGAKGGTYHTSYLATKLLLENGFTKETLQIQISYIGNSALHGADRCLFCDEEQYKDGDKNIELLIKAGANIEAKNREGKTPIFTVNDEAKKILINNGANIFAKTNQNENLLFFVKDLELFKLLVEKGLDPSLLNTKGETTLHHANSKIVDFIVPYIDINKQANDGRTALFFCLYDSDKLLEILKYKPNLNIKSNKGQTALNWYVSKYNDYKYLNLLKNIESLLKAGADVNIKDNNGKSALDISKYEEVTSLLKSFNTK